MLSFETEKRIFDFFIFIIDNQKNLNQIKKIFATFTDLNPYNIFLLFDNNKKGFIDFYDIQKYFEEYRILCTDEEAKTLIKWYDSTNLEKIYFNDFLKIISIKKLEENNNTISYNKTSQLSFEAKNCLCNIFKKELEFIQKANRLIINCRCGYDFSFNGVYNSLQGNELIKKEGINTFMQKHSLQSIPEEDITLLYIRMNIENNEGITYKNIIKIFSFSCDPFILSKEHTFNSIPIFPLSKNNKDNQYNNSTISNSSSLKSQNEFFSSQKESKISTINGSSNYKLNFFKILPEEQPFYFLFEKICQQEKNLEEIKFQLSSQPDFNFEYLFQIFENKKTSSKCLSYLDINYGLNSFNVYPSKRDINLLLKKYSLYSKDCLSYDEFFDIIVPFDKEIRNCIKYRPIKSTLPRYKFPSIFSLQTRQIIERLFKEIINSEREIEILREELFSKCTQIKINALIKRIDINNTGCLENNFFTSFFKDKIIKSYPNNIIDLCFIRFDKDRDGKIQYEDIIKEFLPLYGKL